MDHDEEIEAEIRRQVVKHNERRAVIDLVLINACHVVNGDLDGLEPVRMQHRIRLLRQSLEVLAMFDTPPPDTFSGPMLSEALNALTMRAGDGTGDPVSVSGKDDLAATAPTGADGGSGSGRSGYLIRRHRGRRIQSGD